MRIVKSRFLLISATTLALATGWQAYSAPTALAQPTAAAPTKIAVASPTRIFTDMAETKALQEQMKEEERKFMAEKTDKAKAIDELKNRRDTLLPDHPQWTELNDQLSDLTVEYQVWVQTQKVKYENIQKVRFRTLFKKIEDAVAEIAKRDGIDLVIADNGDPLPPSLDELDVPTVKNLLVRREVLYSASRLDITQSIVTLLDAKYRGVAAAPAPTGLPGH